jgi:hypothetical protein
MSTTIVSPPGTYVPPTATAPLADPGGTYSGANATAPLTDPAGTYTSPYALDRLIIDWKNITPANSVLSFTSATGVENYYGIVSPEATLARQFFSDPGYAAGATLDFTREGLGQRPHLLGANIADVPLATLQAVNGPISIDFNGWTYSGNVNLAGVPDLPTAALNVYTALNHKLPIVATTTGDTIQSETTDFTGYFSRAQLQIVSVQSGTVEIGGLVHGAGIAPLNKTTNQIIYQHLVNGSTPGGAGYYSTAGRLGNVTSPEAMTETYGILTVGSQVSGTIAVGEQVVGLNVPPLTAIIGELGDGQYIVNNAADISGDFTLTAPP